MPTHTSSPAVYPVHIASPSGLQAQVNANGSIRRMDHRDIVLNLFLGNEVEGGPTNLYLRRHGTSIASIPLLGPRSPAVFSLDTQGLTARGEWNGIHFTASLMLAASAAAWFWHVALENRGHAAATVDLVYAQDMALAHYGAVRLNEYYVSQYLDHTPLTHPTHAVVLAVRQNLPKGGRHPWAVLGSLGQGVSFATDALQFHGLATRAGGVAVGLGAPQLPAKRRQHEHAMAVIQDAPVRLEPHAVVHRGFFGWFEADHSAATSTADLAFVDQALALPEAGGMTVRRVEASGTPPAPTLFTASPLLTGLDLSEAEITGLFGQDRRQVERGDDRLLSFFTGAHQHVVLKAKELRVLRPHGHIVRTGQGLTPDEASLTSTTWMAGVFNSMLTQGHVSINRFLSTTRSYLSLLHAHGQRIFVERPDGYALLDVPSAYEMSPNGCRWIYKHADGLIAVRSWACLDRHQLHLSIDILAGAPCRFLIANHIALNGDDGADAVPVRFEPHRGGIVIRPVPESEVGRRFPAGSFRIDPGRGTSIERMGGDELLFADGRTRQQPYLTIVTGEASSVSFRLTGHLIPTASETSPMADLSTEVAAEQGRAERFWRDMTGALKLIPPSSSPLAGDVARLQEILPWLAHNAMIHYLAPRGLEQYSGGGWGTRDVTQGPVEMLLALGRWEPLRDLLIRVYTAQNPDGDWPQWFMFFDRERHIRPGDSHGDIVCWPVLALAEYLLASEDASLLDEVVPFFHPRGHDQAEQATLWAHVERALTVMAARLIPGTHLASYGHGDWNDSLQPADPAMRERLCSAWTVTLHYQTLTTLAKAMRRVGRPEPAAAFEAIGTQVREDFQRLLIVDETLAGFAYFHAEGQIDYWLHPRDRTTGIRYRLLPMIHAIINDLLTPDQAKTHISYIKQHLLGADGARLFDRPPPYRGGPQRYFQRAESSTFFGREIGLMYMHAHLRYAQAMAHVGDAEAFFLALRQANPIALGLVVPPAALRQANCYHSSSDAAFADRYEAMADYPKVKTAGVAFEGGWRIYSSGAGIAMRLIHQCFLGLRREKSALIIDPVIPASLHGLQAETELGGRKLRSIYRISGAGYGPTAVTLNGQELPFSREANPYRTGGAEVPMAQMLERLTVGTNELLVHLG
jgi:1,2-beta-oligoglucan phosphorylase